MSLSNTSGEYVVAAGKASPPLAVTGMGAAGLPLESWVLIATLVYTLLQIALLIRRYVKERVAEKTARLAREVKVAKVVAEEIIPNGS